MASSDVKSLFHVVESGSTCSVSEFLKDASHNADLSLRTLVNQRNELNQSVLHVSCSKLFSSITQILLEAGTDPNAQDMDGRTPVFLLVERLQECNCENCMKKAIRSLTTLSFHGASLDIPNGSDITPLYLCAEHHFVDFTKSMLENGAALGTVNGRPLIEVLAEKMPAVMSTVFDRAVKVKGSKTIQDPDFELIFDLGVILPPQVTLSHPLQGSNGNMNQVFPAEQWLSEKYEACEEMTFLKFLLNHSGQDSAVYKGILKHPLVNVFTDIKWKSLEALYMLFLFMQVKILLAYSAFICATIFIDCPYDLYVQVQRGLTSISSHAQKSGVPGSASFNASDIINPDQLCEINIISKILSIFIIVITVIIILKEVQHAMYDVKDYLRDFFNYFQLVGFASVLFTVIIAWDQESPLYSLLYTTAAFGITISWCQIFIQIGRLPQFAIYIEMFVKISLNFCFSLSIYSFVLIGFAMSFSILFPETPSLMELPLSWVKILTMLVGEMEYEDLFKDFNKAARGEPASSNNNTHQSSLQHRFASRVWYVNFLVFVTLVLMNLLVGLAVSDIQGIRKNAEIYVIKRRIRYIAYLEKSMFEATNFIPRFCQKFMREKICVARASSSKKGSRYWCCSHLSNSIELKSCKLTIFPNNSKRNQYLSTASKMSIRHWLLTKSTSNMARICQLTGGNSTTGFRQRNLANFRKESTTSFIAQQPIFVKEISHGTDSERLKRLEFNVHQMDNKMNEIDLKVDMILKTLMRAD